MSVLNKLHRNRLLENEHDFILTTHYEVMTGSVAYNVAQDTSDMDVHAFCIPPLHMLFPHTTGYIRGFGKAPENFETFQKHHMLLNSKNYDVLVYSIVKLFQLAYENNPNVLDILWVPDNCVLHMDNIGRYVRQNRRNFLSKAAYHKFRGYAYAQMKKLQQSPRKDLIEKYGYDTKYAYHVIRLGLQCQQILEEGDMDLTRNAEVLKSIRRGEWTLERLEDRFLFLEKHLDELYVSSKLQYEPDFNFLNQILLVCIEMKYGSVEKFNVASNSKSDYKLEQIRKVLES